MDKERSNAPVKKGKIDIRKAFNLKFVKGRTYQEIADKFGCSPQSVHKALSKFKVLIEDPKIIETYRANAGKVLNAVEFKLLENLVEQNKLKSASLNNVAYAFQQIHNARRLEEGLSTGNLAINVEKCLTQAHEKAQKMRKKLRDNES